MSPHHQDVRCLQIQLFSSLAFNPIALRKAKIAHNFGLSECNRIIGLYKLRCVKYTI